MEEARGSDISKTQMDLVDLSAEQTQFPTATDDESFVKGEGKGFCVKEYEENLQALKKENFNLKLRIYFLEEKNPNAPAGAEAIYTENINLKIEKENLMKELNDKQDLLLDSLKALDLLEAQKSNELQHSGMMIDELNSRIEALQHELSSLQNARHDTNKSVSRNDTGYADFLGAVDSKDVEYQRKLKELTNIEASFKQKMTEMNQTIQVLHNQKKELEAQASDLLYENNEMKDKMAQVERVMSEQTAKLEKELQEFKEKWAATQCDLQDSEEKLKETEKERLKTLAMFKQTLQNLERERAKIHALEHQIVESCAAGTTMDGSKNDAGALQHLVKVKNSENEQLKTELDQMKRRQMAEKQQLEEKNREIEKLSNEMRNIKARSSGSARFSIEQLSESFNDLKFQQAMEVKKISQQKIGELMDDLCNIPNARVKEQVVLMQQQMAIVVEKQEVADSALGKCAELCVFTLDHLHELAKLLSALLHQKDVRESLSEMTMLNIQSAIDKTFDFYQAGRFSIVGDDRNSSLPNISSLDILMSTARNSLANVKDFNVGNKSDRVTSESWQVEMATVRKELEDMNRINQLLEDEICEAKQLMEGCKRQMSSREEAFVELKAEKDALNEEMKEALQEIDSLVVSTAELSNKLQQETAQKFIFEARLAQSDSACAHLQQKLDQLTQDLELNWITKDEHDVKVRRLEDDIINGEAQVAAIRMEMDELRALMDQAKIEIKPDVSDAATESDKENAMSEADDSSKRSQVFKEDSAAAALMSEELPLAPAAGNCPMCPKYQARVAELKKYLSLALEKLKFNSEVKSHNDRLIQKQLSSTNSFIHQARSNLDSILKSSNAKQE